MYAYGWPPRGGATRALSDARWGQLNRESVEAIKKREWASYGFIRLQQSHQLGWEKKWKQALSFVFEALYLELNGAQNLFPGDDRPPFDPFTFMLLTPVAVEIAMIGIIRNGLDEEGARAFFLEAMRRPHKNMRTPITPERAWTDLAPNWFQDGRLLAEGYEDYFEPTTRAGFGTP